MDKIVGGGHASHGGGQRRRIEHIALNDFGARRDAFAQRFGVAGQATDAMSGGFERVEEAAADIAGSACDEDESVMIFGRSVGIFIHVLDDYVFGARFGKQGGCGSGCAAAAYALRAAILLFGAA